MTGKEQIFRKRYLVLKYNVWPHTALGGWALHMPWVQRNYGSLTTRLWHYEHYACDSAADKPFWTRAWMFGSKKPNYMMWNVGEGGHRMWGHSWQKYKVSNAELPHIDLRGPEPR
eukprot:TRINITY_DN52081_c0_g1_i1.p2 TRINITY_DN52081_c0_g1~~TRINITY_DN52081_c0_g1_i1.p2  ORF type:complete len:115 (+),score=22.67 TRINITY_DN52081_c0_g1_i1:86-430(+)